MAMSPSSLIVIDDDSSNTKAIHSQFSQAQDKEAQIHASVMSASTNPQPQQQQQQQQQRRVKFLFPVEGADLDDSPPQRPQSSNDSNNNNNNNNSQNEESSFKNSSREPLTSNLSKRAKNKSSGNASPLPLSLASASLIIDEEEPTLSTTTTTTATTTTITTITANRISAEDSKPRLVCVPRKDESSMREKLFKYRKTKRKSQGGEEILEEPSFDSQRHKRMLSNRNTAFNNSKERKDKELPAYYVKWFSTTEDIIQENCIVVRNIARSVGDEALYTLFKLAGGIERIQLPRVNEKDVAQSRFLQRLKLGDLDPGPHKGNCLIEFTSPDSVAFAVEVFDKIRLDCERIYVTKLSLDREYLERYQVEVSGLDEINDAYELESIFCEFGDVLWVECKEVFINYERMTIIYVSFGHAFSCLECLEKFDNKLLGSRTVNVRLSAKCSAYLGSLQDLMSQLRQEAQELQGDKRDRSARSALAPDPSTSFPCNNNNNNVSCLAPLPSSSSSVAPNNLLPSNSPVKPMATALGYNNNNAEGDEKSLSVLSVQSSSQLIETGSSPELEIIQLLDSSSSSGKNSLLKTLEEKTSPQPPLYQQMHSKAFLYDLEKDKAKDPDRERPKEKESNEKIESNSKRKGVEGLLKRSIRKSELNEISPSTLSADSRTNQAELSTSSSISKPQKRKKMDPRRRPQVLS